MNSTIAVSIDAGGCSLASMNPAGVPTLIANSDDGSFVTSLEIGMGVERVEIGQAARRYLEDDPGIRWTENVLSLIGTDVSLESDGRFYKAIDLIDCLVGKLRNNVEQSWLGPLVSPIVSVPASLNHLQRQTLMRAFRTAGAENIRLVDSAIAASFHVQPNACQKPILVCDLQTDRVQASLIQIGQHERAVLAVRQSQVEKEDRIYRLLAEELKSSIQSALLAKVDSEMVNRAFQSVAKTMLESILNSEVGHLKFRKALLGSTVEFTMTAERIGKMGERYFERASDCLSKCLHDAGMAWNDIEAVCFIGELSKLTEFVESYTCFASIPMAVRAITGARWASAFGAASMGQREVAGSRLQATVRSLNELGIRVRSGEQGAHTVLRLFSHGMQLPAKVQRTFKTSRMDQERLVLEIVEGTGSEFQVVKLAQFGPLLPQSDRHPIEVRFQWDEQGLLKANAFDGLSKQPIHSCLVSSAVGASPN